MNAPAAIPAPLCLLLLPQPAKQAAAESGVLSPGAGARCDTPSGCGGGTDQWWDEFIRGLGLGEAAAVLQNWQGRQCCCASQDG